MPRLMDAGARCMRLGPKQAKAQAKASGVATKTMISVGSDCSGLATEILAFQSIPYMTGRVAHKFVSEKDPNVRRVLRGQYPEIQRMYKDCTMRDPMKAGFTDFYFNTSPCTTFSAMGKQDLQSKTYENVFR